ncbi:MAG: hypothetical protein R2836_04010 [Chitinophagales bacterium]
MLFCVYLLMMRLIVLVVLLLGMQNSISAQLYLDKEQERIANICNETTDTSCQSIITHLASIKETLKDTSFNTAYVNDLSIKLFYDLKRINNTDTSLFQQVSNKFLLINNYLNAITANDEKSFFKNNKKATILSVINYLQSTAELNEFIKNLAEDQPKLFLSNYYAFENSTLKEKLLTKIATDNPILIKRYLGSNNSIRTAIINSKSDTLALINTIYKQASSLSNAFYLMQKIIDNELSIQQADSIGKNDNYLFKTLINISKNENAIAKTAVNDKLSHLSTLIIRPINAAYEQHESSTRFKPLEKYNATELYTLMIYSEEEIFTSTFEGTYNLFLKKLESNKQDGYTFLQQMNFNEFRTFIKMCAGYGRLSSFLNTMTLANKERLLHKFLNLKNTPNLLKDAVSIADAIGSINDETLQTYIEKDLLSNYRQTDNKKIKLAYGLLINLFAPKATTLKNEYDSIAQNYQIQSLGSVDSMALFGKDGVHTQVHLFYDDEDGITSFATFLQTFPAKNWNIEDKKTYVKISSKTGNAVVIYANKAKFEKEGMKAIDELLLKEHTEVEMLVHRGHSFYVNTSLEKLREETKIVLLGSCGGYHQILNILEKAPDAQIIATKQVGSYTINNPLVLDIAEWVRQGKNIEWEAFWKDFSDSIQSGYAKEKLDEYIPPHKNLGAAFIKAYKAYE